jgi:glycosyltransferase involved in cell wall biosynthesis
VTSLPADYSWQDATEDRKWRVLVVAPFPPRQDGRHGGSRAIGQLLVRLAAHYSVALLVLRGRDEPGVDDQLRKLCEVVHEVEIPPVGTSFRARLANRLRLRALLVRGTPTWAAERSAPHFGRRLAELVELWQPDVVQFEYRIMGQFLPVVAGQVPCLLVDQDPAGLDTNRPVLLGPLEDRAWLALGRTVAKSVDSLVVLTERDRTTVSELSGSTRIARIPLGYELPASPLDPEGTNPYSILAVGSFIHQPNVDAANRLARAIFPMVRSRVPEATLQLVGSQPTDAVFALAAPGVTVHGDVPDVLPYLDAAAVVAAPIRFGGGMRVKVLEALAAGKAIVATPLALEGLALEDGVHVLVAETDEEFADALVELLNAPHTRHRIARAARAWAEQNLVLDAQVRAYGELYSSVWCADLEARTDLNSAGTSGLRHQSSGG